MRKRPGTLLRYALFLAPAGLALTATPAHALDPFTNATDLLNNPNVSSGVAMGVADMNADGLDDIVRLDRARSLEIEFQQPDGSFERYEFGDLPGSQWGLAIGDIDRNGYLDIYTGGLRNGNKILRASDDGTEYALEVSMTPSVFVQCVNFADIDNNGTLDLFICDDDSLSAPMNNDGDGNFTHDLSLINPESTAPPLDLDSDENSGNYGTVWTDYDNDGDLDLYIAKCRQGVGNPDDPRRLNLLFENDGDGNYTDVALDRGLRPGGQSWAVDFGDIDNDGDMDVFLLNHDIPSMLYENLGDTAEKGQPQFVEVTEQAGLVESLAGVGYGIQTHFEDFDNDTNLDLLVTATGGGGEHRLFLNNGDGTFTAEDNPFPTDGVRVQSAVVGDLNADGFPDLVAGFANNFNSPSEGNPDRLLLNPGNDNNWLDIRLTGVASNSSAVGARVELHGEWGVMVREVRAGESYGITNSLTRHFGLGTSETIDTLIVRWPSGHVDTFEDPRFLNQTVHIIEGCAVMYPDADGDGYGDPSDAQSVCDDTEGFVDDDTDCDDTNADRNPGAEEVCDEVDNNCNDEVDEGDVCVGSDSSGEPPSDSSGSPPPPPPADGSDTLPGGTGDTGDTDTDTAGSSGGDGGCGCSSDPAPAPAWMLALFGAAFLRRRRRR